MADGIRPARIDAIGLRKAPRIGAGREMDGCLFESRARARLKVRHLDPPGPSVDLGEKKVRQYELLFPQHPLFRLPARTRCVPGVYRSPVGPR
jgi:hypothetical protein